MTHAETKTQQNYAQKPHILVIDDDARIRELVVRYLSDHDFVVLSACDASEAREVLEHFEVDALVVDVMMPGQTGFEFLKELRGSSNDIPSIMLTALGEIDDRIEGLEAGADDYLAKPFEPRELVLRLHAVLKRGMAAKAKLYMRFRFGPWEFDGDQGVLIGDDEAQVKLTTMEVSLIKALAAKAGEPVSRDELAEACGVDAASKSSGRTIDVQVTRLRRKIEENTKSPRYLQTVRGQGYLLRVDG